MYGIYNVLDTHEILKKKKKPLKTDFFALNKLCVLFFSKSHLRKKKSLSLNISGRCQAKQGNITFYYKISENVLQSKRGVFIVLFPKLIWP